jgi:O-antigen/teichoic acid export membrane protein
MVTLMATATSPAQKPAREASGAGELGRLARGTSIYTLGTVLNKLLLLGIQVLLARQLQVSGYGLYSLGFSALILLQSAALLGLDQSVLRYAALYRNRGDAELVKGTLRASLTLGIGASVAIAAALAAAAPFVSATMFHEKALAPTLELFALALPFLTLTRITGAFAQAHHDILRMTAIQQIAQPGVQLLLVAGLFLFGGGLRWAVVTYVASAAFSAAVGVYSVRAIFPEFFGSLRAQVHAAELLRYALALAAIAILYQLFWRAPSLLLGHLSGAAEVGLYTAAVTLASPPGFISLIFAQPFMPLMVDLHERGSIEELRALYQTVTRWTQLVVIPGLGALLLFRRPVLALFGRDFQTAEGVLIPLGLAWMVYYAKGPVSAVLDMTGRQMVDLLNLAGVLVLSLALGLWLIPRDGVLGAGWAVSASVLAWAVAESMEGWIFFRFPVFSRDLLQSLVLGAAAFGCGLALQGRVSIVLEALGVGAVYVSLGYFFCLTAADRNLLARAIRKATFFAVRSAAVADAHDGAS